MVALVACTFATSPAAEHGHAPPVDWLERVNFYRASASLPPVAEEASLSAPVSEHARYMVVHDVLDHRQDRRQRWSTPGGATAAAVSNLAGSLSATEPDSWAVDVWMQAPFHALGILDPMLHRVGFGIYRKRDGRRIQTAAGLDVIRGRGNLPPDVSYPIVWPSDGTVVPIMSHTAEYPSPLASCPGYKAPAGLPIIVQIGDGSDTPRVEHTSIFDGARALEHCVFDEGTYQNPSREEQDLGRRILDARDAIVLIPREPLQDGCLYQIHVATNGRRLDWTFRVSAR